MVDKDGFKIENCDCDHGDMARRLGVGSMCRTTIHYASALITALSRGDIKDEEDEEQFKQQIAELMVNLVALFYGLSHYVGVEKMGAMMEERDATIAEAREASEKAEAAEAN